MSTHGSNGSGDLPTEMGSRISGGIETTLGSPGDAPTVGPSWPAPSATMRSVSDDRSGPIALQPEPGTIIGDAFRIDGRLGAGGMGVVFRATHLKLERPVAVKLHPGGDADAARLEREARAMARLSHPNVIGVFDVGTWRDAVGTLHVFIAMELCDAGTLRAFIARRPDWRMALDTCRQAGEGLAAAHAAGLVHRDFKPDNVLCSSDGRVRVADFGLARTQVGGDPDAGLSTAPAGSTAHLAAPADQLTRTGAMVGTPAYMAPEQFGGGSVDARADQFSFCVVVYEALWGHRPFTGATAGELLYNIAMRGPDEPPRSDVPPRVWAVLRRGLDPDPRRRYATMRALLSDLDRARKAVGPSGLAVAFAIAVPIAIVGSASWWFLHGRDRQRIAIPRIPAVTAPADLEPTDDDEPPAAAADVDEDPVAVESTGISDPADPLSDEDNEARWQAVQRLGQTNPLEDPIGLARALEDAQNSGAGDLALTMALMQSMMRAAEPTDTAATQPNWDGRSTLHCGMGQRFRIEGKTIEIAEGPAFEVAMGCVLEVIGCTITASVIVQGTHADRIEIRDCSITASEAFAELSHVRQLSVHDSAMQVASSGAALTLSFTTADIIAAELQGNPAIVANFGSTLYVEGGALAGDPHAIVASHGKIELADVDVRGTIDRRVGSTVITVERREPAAAP